VGRSVEVCHQGQKIVIRSGDLIVAEHSVASKSGSSVTQKEHLDQLWKLAMQRTPEPLPSWRLTFEQQVAATPLDRYEQLLNMTSEQLLDVNNITAHIAMEVMS
jgi:hypothetical protein